MVRIRYNYNLFGVIINDFACIIINDSMEFGRFIYMAKRRRKARRSGGGALMFLLFIALCAGAIIFAVGKLYPLAYQDIIEANAKKYGLDSNLVYAVIKTESKFDPKAKSSRGAKGLMQIMDATGEWGYKEIDQQQAFSAEMLFDPEINVEIGCWYLRKLIDQYKNVDMALAAYNAGSGNVAKWIANPEYFDGQALYNIPFKETANYMKRVNNSKRIYEKLRHAQGAFGRT